MTNPERLFLEIISDGKLGSQVGSGGSVGDFSHNAPIFAGHAAARYQRGYIVACFS